MKFDAPTLTGGELPSTGMPPAREPESDSGRSVSFHVFGQKSNERSWEDLSLYCLTIIIITTTALFSSAISAKKCELTMCSKSTSHFLAFFFFFFFFFFSLTDAIPGY